MLNRQVLFKRMLRIDALFVVFLFLAGVIVVFPAGVGNAQDKATSVKEEKKEVAGLWSAQWEFEQMKDDATNFEKNFI